MSETTTIKELSNGLQKAIPTLREYFKALDIVGERGHSKTYNNEEVIRLCHYCFSRLDPLVQASIQERYPNETFKIKKTLPTKLNQNIPAEHRPINKEKKEEINNFIEATNTSAIDFVNVVLKSAKEIEIIKANQKKANKKIVEYIAQHEERIKKVEQKALPMIEQEEELYKLKHMPYKKYLNTRHWKIKREEALQRAGYKCQLCGDNKGLVVHHNNYDNKGNELPADLIVLCSHCHNKFHGMFQHESK